MTVPQSDHRWRFGLLYAVANVGVFICFIPLITLILPHRALDLAPDGAIRLLSWTLLLGGIVSSLANIAAGLLSDRIVEAQGSRLPLVGIGYLLTMASLALLANVGSAWQLVGGFILFQFAFNTLFSPFNALATDHIADADKGRVFGWLSLGLPMAQIAVLGMVRWRLDAPTLWFWTIVVTVTLLLAPLLTIGRRWAGQRLTPSAPVATAPDPQARGNARQWHHDFIYTWIGRFFMQCAAVGSGSFMLVHLSSMTVAARHGVAADALFGIITFMSLLAGLSIGLLVGLWSDHSGRRRPFLFYASSLVALGFVTMSLAHAPIALLAGYGLFAVGFAAFITIDGAIIAEIVASRSDRASRLGIINLSNTLPSMVIPGVSLTIDRLGAPPTPTLFLCIAVGAMISAWSTSRLRTVT